MTDCSLCIKIKNESMQNVIEENKSAIGIASDYFRLSCLQPPASALY